MPRDGLRISTDVRQSLQNQAGGGALFVNVTEAVDGISVTIEDTSLIDNSVVSFPSLLAFAFQFVASHRNVRSTILKVRHRIVHGHTQTECDNEGLPEGISGHGRGGGGAILNYGGRLMIRRSKFRNNSVLCVSPSTTFVSSLSHLLVSRTTLSNQTLNYSLSAVSFSILPKYS